MLPSASSLNRVKMCPASVLLPQTRTPPNTNMELGTAVHAYLENVRNLGADAALAKCSSVELVLCQQLDLSQLPVGTDCIPELGLSWDVLTGAGRSFTVAARQYYGIGATEFYGTSDVVKVTKDAVWIYDYKVGFGAKIHTTRSKDNLQLRFYALAAARAYGKDTAFVQLVHIGNDASLSFDTTKMDFFDLEATEVELRKIYESIQEAKTDVVTIGDHCKYCPAFPSCPARGSMLADFLDEQKFSQLGRKQVIGRIEYIETYLKHVKEALKVTASEESIEVSPGRYYGLIQTKRDKINKVTAIDVLRDKFPAIAELAIQGDITKPGLRIAIQRIASQTNADAAALEGQVFKQLRESGALVETVAESVRHYKQSDTEIAT